MKSMIKLVTMGTMIVVATNYVMPMLDKKTKRKIKRKMKDLQYMAEDMLNKTVSLIK